MGIIRMGVPEELALFLKDITNASCFIETGTFQGGTALWAAKHFERVRTIEFSKKWFDKTSQMLKSITNIDFIFGDSRVELKLIIEKLKEPSIFWLDAHWCNMGSYGEEDQCPLIEEIEILSSSPLNHCILIDDARLFTAPPPIPNSCLFYPSISEVIRALEKNQSRYTVIFEDVIFSIPNDFRLAFQNQLQDLTTRSWREYGARLNEKKSHKRKRLINELIATFS